VEAPPSSIFDMAVAQCMLPSPIRLKTVSTPSLAKALASISYIGKLLIGVSLFS